MLFLRRFLLLLGLVALIGCDTAPVNPAPDDADDITFELRLMLQDAADTGMLAADFSDSADIVAEIKETDATKGEALEIDLKALQALSDPEQIKTKAQETLSKL